MQACRRGHHAHVDAGPDETLDLVNNRNTADQSTRVAGGVGDAHQVHAVQALQDASVMATDGPQPDDPGAEGGHASFTALATVSRSCAVRAGWIGKDSTSRAARSVSGSFRSSWKDGSRWIGVG